MKWAPPLVELIRPVARLVLPLRVVSPLIITTLLSLTGCTALPALQSARAQVAMNEQSPGDGTYSDAERLRLSHFPATPDFDEPGIPAASSASFQPIIGAARVGVATPDRPASVQLPTLRIDAPRPFAWQSTGITSGQRSFQTVTVGDEGYRTLVIGSVAGNDPLAVELVEQLARHLHDGKMITGGFQTKVLRTLNPDGEALGKILNEKGQYINHGFPKDGGIADANQPVEVMFLLNQIQTSQPQRVIHIRTIEGDSGLIAASSGCLPVANDVAEWLGFRVISLPEKAVSGSLERYLASSDSSEILTFAIPATSKKDELWDRYGDTLQNLLMGDDYNTRELARRGSQKSSASRRNADER